MVSTEPIIFCVGSLGIGILFVIICDKNCANLNIKNSYMETGEGGEGGRRGREEGEGEGGGERGGRRGKGREKGEGGVGGEEGEVEGGKGRGE